MRGRRLRRRRREHAERGGELLGLLLGELALGPRRERRRAEPEEEVAALVEPVAQQLRRLLRAPVLGEPAGELLGGLLGLELGELGVLLREHRARLQLEQRGDQDEELAAGVEVELAAVGEVLDERDHDLGQVDLAERQLLAEHQRQQEVERPLERVEVQLEFADGQGHPERVLALPDAALGDRHRRALLRRRRFRLAGRSENWCQTK